MTITNSGAATVKFTKESLQANMYSVSGFTMPSSLAPGAQLTISLKFSPLEAGTVGGYIAFGSNASNSLVDYALTGVGVANQSGGTLSSTPGSVNFGSVAVGTTNSQTIQLKNTGTVALSVTGAALSGSSEFKLCGLTFPFTLAASEPANCTVTFAASATGSVSGSAVFTSTATDKTLLVSLSGQGAAATRTLAATPTSLNFGNVTEGATATLDVVLKNTGNSSVAVTGITASGTGLTVGGGVSGATIEPGQSATLEASYSPAQAGTLSGKVAIVSNASDSPLDISVIGDGVSSAKYSVSLSWAASESSGIAGYNVYRATSPGTTYTKLTPTLTKETDYVDGTVSAGKTYSYEVTAVNTEGLESTPSSPASAGVP